MIAFEPRFVRIGTFFFRHRNWAFPVLVAGFFLITAPTSTVFGSEALDGATDCAAVLFSFAGLTLRALVIGHDYVSRAGEGKAVHASRLLTRGMFALCRNPLYTGNILIFLGFFLMHGNPLDSRPGLGELRVHLSRDRRRRGGLPPRDLRRRLRRVLRFDAPFGFRTCSGSRKQPGDRLSTSARFFWSSIPRSALRSLCSPSPNSTRNSSSPIPARGILSFSAGSSPPQSSGSPPSA